MDRLISYVGESVYEWMLSLPGQQSMTALAKLSASLFGQNTTAIGFECTQTAAASLGVLVAPGHLYMMESLEATACGTLPADTAHTILKQGISLDTTTLTLAAPTTAGYSIAYLIQATYQDSDVSLDPTTNTSNVVLSFYNSTDPTTPYSGPNNTGATSNTIRKGVVTLSAKSGTPATTGSQVTPSPDSGCVGLWVATVAYGQTTVTSSNIAAYAATPRLPAAVLPGLQASSFTYAADAGTANTYKANYYPVITSLTDGMILTFNAANANTGASTFAPNGLTAYPIVGAAHSALQSGEIVSGGRVEVMWHATLSSWVLLGSTGGAIQVGAATQGKHAPQMSQVAGVVGQARNLVMTVASASATATLAADEIIVETALGGVRYCLASFSKTIDLATTGAGGMDAGSAPASGYVALYAIYNPSTQTAALLASNATSASAPSVYGGSNMPAGYTASALVSVWPTNASKLLSAGFQHDRYVGIATATAISTTSGTNVSPATALSISGIVPPNARAVSGYFQTGSSQLSSAIITVSANATQWGVQLLGATITSAGGSVLSPFRSPVSVAQTLYYTATVSSGTATFAIQVTGYDF